MWDLETHTLLMRKTLGFQESWKSLDDTGPSHEPEVIREYEYQCGRDTVTGSVVIILFNSQLSGFPASYKLRPKDTSKINLAASPCPLYQSLFPNASVISHHLKKVSLSLGLLGHNCDLSSYLRG